jgi:hypothetical protein
VRRRELLASAAGIAGATALGLPSVARPDKHQGPARGLEKLLYGNIEATPVPLTALRSQTLRARGDFQAARYEQLAAGLPALLATAAATRDHTEGDGQSTASALLADAYTVATNLMIKLNDDQLAWATADRAAQAAQHSGDPLTLADARRAIATVMRRTGKATAARTLLIDAAHDIEPDGHATPAQLSTYGTLLQVAAYTAAIDGNRHAAHELINEAATTAQRLGTDANHRFTAFGPTNVILYKVSIAQVLGDNGTAIEHAKTLRPADIPTPERQGRYWIDVARAYHQWGKIDHCYTALRSAERAAPAEVRYRPPAHRMTHDLLRADRRGALPGLHAFATRVGFSA